MKNLSVTTFNLYNLNRAGLPIYTDRDGWSDAEYAAKITYTASVLKRVKTDIIGFQELWHGGALEDAFQAAGLDADYDLVFPPGHDGGYITCAAAVRKGLIQNTPVWIKDFPDALRLASGGDDPQTAKITVNLDSFSRPVLNFKVQVHDDVPAIEIYICHFKSKGPTKIYRENWFKDDKPKYKDHVEAIGSALSTIRRTAEASALRVILTETLKHTDTPVIVLGDINDGQRSNTLNIVTGQPNYLLSGLSTGGSDVDLYTAQTLQEYRSQRDVYYTHSYKNTRESLDHILVSQEFYDNSKRRIWAFDGMTVDNDHLNHEDHKETGTNDHGIVSVQFKYKPASGARIA